MAFTGENLYTAIKEIYAFEEEANNIARKLGIAWEEFTTSLSEKWYSKIAVEVTTDFCDKFYNIQADLWNSIHHIVNGANTAARNIAISNGIYENLPEVDSGINPYDFRNDLDAVMRGIPCSEVSPAGIIGMDREQVRIALELFESKVKNILVLFDSLPTGISFYDDNDQLVNTYKRGINDFKNRYQELFLKVSIELRNKITTEEDVILLAKEQATAQLNG